MKKLLKYFLLTAFIILNSGCDKILQIPEHPTDEYGLPEYSETGRGTLACLVNGEPWIAERKGGLYRSPTGTINLSRASFKGGGDDSGVYLSIILDLDADYPEKKYFVLQDTLLGGGVINHYGDCREPFRTPLNYDNNWIDVTKFNAETRILSGYFEFTIINDLEDICSDTLHLTQGRFDLIVEYID